MAYFKFTLFFIFMITDISMSSFAYIIPNLAYGVFPSKSLFQA